MYMFYLSIIGHTPKFTTYYVLMEHTNSHIQELKLLECVSTLLAYIIVTYFSRVAITQTPKGKRLSFKYL